MEKHQTDSQSGAVSGEDQKMEAEKKSRKKLPRSLQACPTVAG